MVQACSRQEHRQPKGTDAGCCPRKHVIRSIAAAEQVIRGLLRPLGLKVGVVSRTLFATRVRELVGDDALLEAIMNPLLAGREALIQEYARLHRLVLKAVRSDPGLVGS
ncbi:hypothetical protein SAMN05216338_10781 [Bradyrhizobium sp. Rc2d]|uniref:hypothetical protein n=1 Tax=Bradyrhizobium sp. Rc2d TaxID=1855321 RepID=UPI00088DC189|nr:hypothetical protein [Bradyrhizobium sp. Rc2d]SDJ98699.1 hypothetical protein SAMN05216338_10781 [Bradyrhizobium sp. Rc2d]